MTRLPRSEGGPVSYELCLQGHLDRHWFTGLTVIHNQDGTTSVRGTLADQAELHGLLSKVRDLGATLLSVTSPRSVPIAASRAVLEDDAGRGNHKASHPPELEAAPEAEAEGPHPTKPPQTRQGERS